MNAETSHKAGEQGFVNTIFRLRLRRCEDNDKQSQTPGKEKEQSVKIGENFPQRVKALDAGVGEEGRQRAQTSQQQKYEQECQ